MADVVMKLSLCALSVVAIIMKRRQKRQKPRKILTREWLRNRTIFGAYYNLLGELRNLDVSSCRNFLRMYVTPFEELLNVSHSTIFVILRSYIVQARKSLVQIDQLTGVIKIPVELCYFQLFGRHADISTKPRDTKLEND